MPDQAEICRKKAVECERAALLATKPDSRLMYIDLARLWRELAIQSNELNRNTERQARHQQPSRQAHKAMEPRAMLERHLEQAGRHVAEGEQHVARQRELVAELESGGHDTASAQASLSQFKELLALHTADRDRIRAELAQFE